MPKDPRMKLRKIKTRQPFLLEEGGNTYLIATRHGAAQTNSYQIYPKGGNPKTDAVLCSRDYKVLPVKD